MNKCLVMGGLLEAIVSGMGSKLPSWIHLGPDNLVGGIQETSQWRCQERKWMGLGGERTRKRERQEGRKKDEMRIWD